MSVHVNAQLHALENSYATRERGSISIKVLMEEERKTQVFGLDMICIISIYDHIYIYEGQNSGNLNFCARGTYGAPI